MWGKMGSVRTYEKIPTLYRRWHLNSAKKELRIPASKKEKGRKGIHSRNRARWLNGESSGLGLRKT